MRCYEAALSRQLKREEGPGGSGQAGGLLLERQEGTEVAAAGGDGSGGAGRSRAVAALSGLPSLMPSLQQVRDEGDDARKAISCSDGGKKMQGGRAGEGGMAPD